VTDDARRPEARPEFRRLSESEVWKTIDGDAFNDNPVTAEVTRLGVAYMCWVKARAKRHGPGNVPPVEVRWPIERVAVLMVMSYVEMERGAPPCAPLH
jgi:hypothetical protein